MIANLARSRTPFAKVFRKSERGRCPRAGGYGPSPGGSGIMSAALRPAREVLTGLGQAKAGNARQTTSQEAWPELRLGVTFKSPWREPRWNGRQASAPRKAEPQPDGAEVVAQRLPAFASFCSGTKGRRQRSAPSHGEGTGFFENGETATRAQIAPRERDRLSAPAFRGAGKKGKMLTDLRQDDQHRRSRSPHRRCASRTGRRA